MVEVKQSPQEFIRDAFTPQIAVMCSSAAQKSCEKNNLDFTELLQPFSKITNDVSYRNPSGLVTTIKSLKLTFLDVNSRPPQTALARKLLNASVSEASEPKMKIHQEKNYQLDVPVSTPWFDRWRDTFLRVQYPSDHEFTKHFLACLLVVSSNENVAESVGQLIQNINQIQGSAVPGNLPKWFSSNILKYYVILHDNVEGNFAVASEAFESLKMTYGAANSFLLRMNSRPPGSADLEHLPDPWSQFLSSSINTKNLQITPNSSPDSTRHTIMEIAQEANETKNLNYHPLSPEIEDIMANMDLEKEDPPAKITVKWHHGSCLSVVDVEQIKIMIFEFTRACLVPYLENQLVILNDAVANKKGVSKSLLSATKRWFSANKPSVTSSAAVNNLIYATDAPELQIRRLGDLYFMFGNYSAAFQAYHGAKRDYNADQAWLYYAGALEMAALSAFMADESSRKTYDYMEESITTYLNTCKMAQFATRATILSSECLKSKQLYGETAHQLIRMTSEDSDLRSALLLEQASYCFMHSSMLRKYAFHMVLSGHRFSKAAQKKHALRCYKQAYQIFNNTGWDLASDHIHYTIGRLGNNLQKFDEAVEFFSKLLRGESKQSSLQQGTFLKEYLTILGAKLKKDESNETQLLPVPELNNSSLKVLVGPTRPLSTPGKIPALGIHFNSSNDTVSEQRWHKLEEMILEETGSAPLIFKPNRTLYTFASMETNTVLAVINEPIQISIQLINSLQIALLLKDLYLLWEYENETNEVVSNLAPSENLDRYIKTYVTKSLIIQSNSTQELVLSLTPLITGNVKILAVCYILTGSSNTVETIFVKGKKVFNVSSDPSIVKPISVKVVPYAPCLQMTFSEMNLDFLAGELQQVSIDLQNTGSVPLKNIMIATSVPHLLSSCELKKLQTEYTINDGDTPQAKEKLTRKNHITSVPLPEGELASGQTISFHIWVRAPQSKGPCSIDLLTYYENIDARSTPRYRLIRHSWNLTVQESISVDVSTQASFSSSTTEDLALALKTSNLNNIHNPLSTEITLLNIALISDRWILTKDIVTPSHINLNCQESAHILIRAKRKVHKDQYSSVPLSSDRASLPHLSTAFQMFARKSHTTLLNAFNPSVERGKKDGTLILEWRALVCDASSRRIVHGHTCVPVEVNRGKPQLDKLISDTGIDLNSPMTSEEETAEHTQYQVTYNLLYPSVVKHNFQETSSCVVPITLVLHSIVAAKVTVIVDTTGVSPKVNPNINKACSSNLYAAQGANSFCWSTNGKIIRTLEPLTTTSVKLSVIVTHPGTFDLGANLEVFCDTFYQTHDSVLQAYEVPSSLVVVDSIS